MSDDPRFVIDYGKYVGPGKTKNSVGSLVAFLAVYAGLRNADSGQASRDGFRLSCGILAKIRGTFEHPVMGWVPVFDFVRQRDEPNLAKMDNDKIHLYEQSQAEFLKRLVLGDFKELP